MTLEKKLVKVGIGECKISSSPEDTIRTFALGSCVAVIVHDRKRKSAGLIHLALPDSNVNEQKAVAKPSYFVDTGLPLLLKQMGVSNGRRPDVSITLAGGSNIMDEENRFNIGKRNILAVKKCLWKHNLGVRAEDVGGSKSRTVSVDVASGQVTVFSGDKTWTL
ncbi:MAG: chemotaxis protein CheD [Spirochaetales bacterium]|nr:chemotaxis protein CheD [Spirochaetales bacterium]